MIRASAEAEAGMQEKAREFEENTGDALHLTT